MDTNQITRFDFQGNDVLLLTDEQWGALFVGKDVAKVLRYSDANKAVAMHVDKEDEQNCQNAGFDSQRGMTLINESGL